MKNIIIRGAKENNLKGIDIKIPRNRVVCFVGVSGSGKSTIAFDIIAREGQRQYFESLPSYARRYLQKNNRPDVEEIKGISASIIISQDRVRGNPRSTVGTLTEAYTYLRLLYSRVGLPSMDSSCYSFNHPYGFCKRCKGLGREITINVDLIIDQKKSVNEGGIRHHNYRPGTRMFNILEATQKIDMDKRIKDFEPEELEFLLYSPHITLKNSDQGFIQSYSWEGIIGRGVKRADDMRGTSEQKKKYEAGYWVEKPCPECHGGRLNNKSLEVKINGKNIGDVSNMPLEECLAFIKNIDHKNAEAIKPRLVDQLEGLINVGVEYLSLNRSADTLSGGEAQRVKMARQLGCDLVETIYVLDEPTAGLHPRDVIKVIENLKRLRNNGNSVIVVEHDETVIKNSDYLVEIGPGGGKKGGKIVATGDIDSIIANPNSLTGQYLGGVKFIRVKTDYRKSPGMLKIIHASRHNLKDLNIEIPTGIMVAITGVSGSGKSSLVEEIISQSGDKVILIDQKQVGANRRGCIATYTGTFDKIRKYFADEHRMHPSFFSFNSRGGCDLCKGIGFVEMEMNFLGDVRIKCEKCGGSRYKKKVLRYKYKGTNIAQILTMTAGEIKEFFDDQEIKAQMSLLNEVGLDYIEMGQTLDTLSGGESQRLKLASKLQTKGEFYILDEPTSGLHFADIEKLLALLNKLVDNGNTVLVVEHNLDVIKNSDWIIDLGPEGGEKGGQLVARGTPLQVSRVNNSYTGNYLNGLF
jgi:excinuclease UvrABC ATPase subunit